MKHPFGQLPVSLLLAAAASAGPGALIAADAAQFESLREQVETNLDAASDEQVIELLREARAAHRYFEAGLVVKSYLGKVFNPKPALLLAAAENAVLGGELSIATGYYKRYLRDASVSEESALAAANLYELLIDQLDQQDDAYQHMLGTGLRFRDGHPHARRFDTWFLAQARKRRDFDSLALGLEGMFAGKPSLAMRHQFLWPALREALGELRFADAKQAETVKRFVALIDSTGLPEADRKELIFYGTIFDFRLARSVDGDQKAMAKLGRVLRAASEYVASKGTADSLVDVCRSIGAKESGRDFEERWWREHYEQLLPTIVDAHGKLPADEQGAFGYKRIKDRIVNDLGNPKQWYQAGARHPALFAHENFRRYSFDDVFVSGSAIGKQITDLAGKVGDSQHDFARLIRSLQAGNDLKSVMQHWFKQESWALSSGDIYELADDLLVPAVAHRIGGDDEEARKAAIDAATWMAAFGTPWLTTTPVLAHEESGAREILERAWAGQSRGEFIKTCQSLRWIPFDRRTRDRGIDRFYKDRIRRHFDHIDNQLRKGRRKLDQEEISRYEADLKQRAAVEQAVQALASSEGLDTKGAPHQLARAYVDLSRSQNARELDKALAPIIAMADDFVDKRQPAAFVYLDAALGERHNKPLTDGQAQVLDGILGSLGGVGDGVVKSLLNQFERERNDWPGRIREEERKEALRYNQALARGLKKLFAQDQVDASIWGRFLETRRGRGWHESGAATDVLKQAIDQKMLPKLYTGRNELAWVKAMYLVAREFEDLKDQYPPASWFDDLVVGEMKERDFVSIDYWDNGGKDPTGKVTKTAAEILAGYKILPTVKASGYYRYEPETFGKLEWKIFGENADKVPEAVMASLRQHFGSRYDSHAMGSMYFSRQPALGDAAAREEFFGHLAEYLQRMGQMPMRLSHPDMRSFERDDISFADLSEREMDLLVTMLVEFPSPKWSDWNGSETLARGLPPDLIRRGRVEDVIRLAPNLWRIRDREVNDALLKVASEQAENGEPEVGASIASAGLEVAQGGLDEGLQRNLSAIVGKVRSSIGAILVSKSDPSYPVFLAQRNWQVGLSKGAWDSYREEGVANVVLGMLGELDPQFSLWLINEHIRRQQLDEAETLVRAFLTWMDTIKVDIGSDIRAQILLSQADIAYEAGEYAVARSRYKYIAESEEFNGLQSQLLAELKVADADRRQRKYDSALQILEKLERRPDTYVRAMALFYKARVAFDQELYAEANEQVTQSLELYEDNTEATFLRQQIDIQMKNYFEAKQLDIGSSELRKKLWPGKPLTIRLRDKTKKLFGRASNVELSVWTEKMKDKETVTLGQVGEDGTIYEATVPTEMGPMREEDHKIQILGDDRIYFDLSDDFKRGTNFQGESTQRELVVHSDGQLYASSSEILTAAELEEIRKREMIAETLGLSQDEAELDTGVNLAAVRAYDEVRPGNVFNIRVVDLDRNYSDGIDKVAVDISVSSGDRIRGYVINEADAYSGSFEGKVQTAKRPPYAMASDMQPGHDPNAVVSPNKTGELLPWIGASGKSGPRTFSVDLNDLVSIGQAKLLVGEEQADRAATRIIVQTSLNNQVFQTVGSYPDAFQPWDGRLQVDVIPTALAATDYQSLRTQFDVHHLSEKSGRKRLTPASGGFSVSWDNDFKGIWDGIRKAAERRQDGNDRRRRDSGAPPVGIRVRSAFWVDRRATKTYYLMGQQASADGRSTGPQLFIDGRLINQLPKGADIDESGPIGFPIELSKGLHTIELFYQVAADGGDKADAAVKSDIPEPPYTAELAAADLDLDQVPAEVLRQWRVQAVDLQQSGSDFTLDFGGLATRVVRFWLMDYGSDAPSLRQIEMTNFDGEQVLPNAEDYTTLLENDTLEIAPGDKITLSYSDPHTFDVEGAGVSEAYLTSTFYNGGIQASFAVLGERGEESFFGIRRFDIGDPVMVFVQDNDLDISDEEDSLMIQVQTSEGKRAKLPAVETGIHTGVFRTTMFPVAGEPKRGTEIQVKPGDDVFLRYLDEENVDPGIPTQRQAVIEQAVWQDPEFRVYKTSSEALPLDEVEARRQAQEAAAAAGVGSNEAVVPNYRLIVERPETGIDMTQTAEPTSAVIGGPLLAEVTWPTVCKATNSSLTIYAQTRSGREKAGVADGSFDTSVPGTIAITGGPRAPSAGGDALPPGYADVLSVGTRPEGSPMDVGTFGFSIPMQLGDCPSYSLATPDGKERAGDDYALYVSSNDEVYVGFRFEDRQGQERWFSQTVQLVGDALFDVMDRDYEEAISERYVGEQVHLRVVNPMANLTGDKDVIEVTVETASGYSATVQLMETLSHSGIFKGLVEFVHQKDRDALEEKAMQNAVPVAYGDEVTLTYSGAGTPITHNVTISKGSDGVVVPFTKKFKDPEIAMRTMFSIAEAYFEMAKKHRTLAEQAEREGKPVDQQRLERIAREEIRQGKKLLTEAIRDFPDNQIRAQADYLQAELALELAKDTELQSRKDQYFTEALGLFGDIIARYPGSDYAPKAQFKKALVYEKMDKMDLACAEYVKISYKYPGSELIADTIARLGNYYLTEGDKLNKRADALAETDPIEAEQIRLQADELFTTAGNVFSKLRSHFPDHALAAKTTVAAGMCMMWAGRWQEAHNFLSSVVNDPQVTEPKIKAEAYYWLGDTYMRMVESGATIEIVGATQGFDAASLAYQTFMKLIWDYPESKWARFARGQLSSGALSGQQ